MHIDERDEVVLAVGTLTTGYPAYKLQVKTAALAPASRLGAAPGLPCVLVASAPASQLEAPPGLSRVPVAPALASRLRATLGSPHVTWAPAPTVWLRAAPEMPCVPRTDSVDYKQLNKYPLTTRPS
jgi:hypothetical protein